jgi:hypothetical protein
VFTSNTLLEDVLSILVFIYYQFTENTYEKQIWIVVLERSISTANDAVHSLGSTNWPQEPIVSAWTLEPWPADDDCNGDLTHASHSCYSTVLTLGICYENMSGLEGSVSCWAFTKYQES